MRQELFDGLHVWWLPIGLLIAVLSAWWSSRRHQHTNWSGVPTGLPRSWRQRTRWVPRSLGWLALLLLLFGLTGPRGVREHREVTGEGLAITLCVDRSGSMLALDLADSVVRRSRLDVVKDVVDRFVRGDTTMAGRRGDLLSIVQFGTHADEVTPPTFDHEYVAEAVEGLEVSALESERATAIGDALGLAVERLDALRAQDVNQTIGDQIIILLTDGESNAGVLSPLEAAELARALDVRVYTIGAGTTSATAPIPMTDPFTGRQRIQNMPVSLDMETLKAIAEQTGGQAFRATDQNSLVEIYAEIDALERTEYQETRWEEVRDDGPLVLGLGLMVGLLARLLWGVALAGGCVMSGCGLAQRILVAPVWLFCSGSGPLCSSLDGVCVEASSLCCQGFLVPLVPVARC